MKFCQKLISLILSLLICVSFSLFSVTNISAHNAMLEVTYDDCEYCNPGDGIDETWYVLNRNTSCNHYSHEESTIKYYFAESSEDNTYTWTTDLSESEANEVKNAYANSMKKWNNVYYYSYDLSGNVVKQKIINIVEGTASDHNIIIYPSDATGSIASTTSLGSPQIMETGEITHKHYDEWKMVVYVEHFYEHANYTSEYVNFVRERNGAHEFGHILGLRDVDFSCNADTSTTHHHELIMGYGAPTINRSQNITYKDIAGAAITRGYHTDTDHKWLNCGLQNNGKYKLLCSICNGVKEVGTLDGYTYYEYGSCGNDHWLPSGNMMAVASYGTQDYYKCKYCRYVAPFSDIISQSYIVSNYDSIYHKYVNNVSGLNYTFYEEHNLTGTFCATCGHVHNHSYTIYIYNDHSTHIKKCACGESKTEVHYVKASEIMNNRYARCIGCGRRLDLNEDDARIVLTNIRQMSVNGSYVLNNGIVVLEDADIEAYMNGTLRFFDRDELPTTE